MTLVKLVKTSLQRRDLLRSPTSNLHLWKRSSDRFEMLCLFNTMFLVLTWLSLKQKHFEIFLARYCVNRNHLKKCVGYVTVHTYFLQLMNNTSLECSPLNG